ncbi:hypothetical protein HMPREF1544_05386 [Mucor circinelloides 1006PhL]|uniref:Uncharacterized protein n=1 Tax=Mucor circinelloides f. circinelloides (strain 1006PhL) TaxID=1220926 RepID=S2JH78_MUCC1|nr:hypothetical protein HMPREF1544_05386 [Mucor circinelloides 1006PhL]
MFAMASCIFAIPIQQQQHFQLDHHSIPPTKKIPSSYINTYKNINELESYYSNIVNQVVDTTVSEIIETAPETYLTIHELQFAGREYCRITLKGFLDVLEHELTHHIKDNLLASIRPLLEGYNKNDVIEYNHYISQQLGSILNPKQFSQNIIRAVYHENQDNKDSSTVYKIWKLITNPTWAQTVHHESNESMALEAWLHSWLMDIEYTLKDDFDAKVYSLSLTL